MTSNITIQNFWMYEEEADRGTLPYAMNAQGIHLQKLHFEHTSKGKTRNPKSTNLGHPLSQ